MTAVFILRRDALAAARLQSELGATPRIRIAGVARSLHRARQLLGASGADIVIADLRLDDGTVLSLTHELHPKPPRTSTPKLLLITPTVGDPLLIESLRAGADGYVMDGDPGRPIGLAIAEAMRDEAVMAPDLARQIAAYFLAGGKRPHPLRLSDANRELLTRLERGLLPHEIARLQSQQEETTASQVRRTIRQLYRKLQWDLRAGSWTPASA